VPPSFEQLFITNNVAAAARCAADTGLWTSVVLAQWADETAWGTSRAWVYGHNPAGISPGGVIASYPSEGAGFAAWVETMELPAYAPVRSVKSEGPQSQALALGRSPWAGGKYIAEGSTQPGSALVSIIISMDLTAYDGAEETLNPAPKPVPVPQPIEEEEVNPFVSQLVGSDAEFIVWPDGEKSFIAEGTDTAALLKQWGQSAVVPLSAGTLGQIPSKPLPAGATPVPA
jgi:hypothetical protein